MIDAVDIRVQSMLATIVRVPFYLIARKPANRYRHGKPPSSTKFHRPMYIIGLRGNHVAAKQR